jgi:23S rRNA pseudouridine1911/1915/1917 synthase
LKLLDIIFEDNHLIAINKVPGTLVQGDKTGDTPLSEQIKDFIKIRDAKPGNVYLGVPHRLDRPTSGVVVFAKTSKILPRMNALFANKETQKTYWAVVQNPPEKKSDILEHWLIRNNKQNKSYAHFNEIPESKLAILKYTVIKKLDRYYLLEIDLYTGRHHQIRAQLASVGCHIKGDLKYGAPRSNSDGSIHLHAKSISFIHPVKKTKIIIEAPLPKDPLWLACLSY